MEALKPYLWSALTFLLGLVIGHWLSLGRDKRKEFNQLSGPIREWAVVQIARPDDNLRRGPSTGEVDAIAQRMFWWRRRKLIRSLRNVELAYKSNTTVGGGVVRFKITEEGLAELRKIRDLMKPR